jgi:hypothetical protein
MPNAPKNKHRSVRFSDEDWDDLDTATKAQDSDRGTVIKELVAWYLRRPGAKLPARPEAGGGAAMPAGPVANPGRTRAAEPDAEG